MLGEIAFISASIPASEIIVFLWRIVLRQDFAG
jgi:hypothetical protein